MAAPPASLWWATLPDEPTRRAPLGGDLDVDVCIVGGGYTGLWTARELLVRDPALRVVILEREQCGFGASGRNGGWASSLFPLSDEAQIARWGLDAHQQLRQALYAAVAELGAAIADEQIDAQFHQGGSLRVARSEIQASRLRAAVAATRARGATTSDLRWMEADEAADRIRTTNLYGASFTPHCARLHPARLAVGLAAAVARRGATIFEDTPVTRILPARRGQRARAVTAFGTVSADYVVRATEGFTAQLGARRELAPLYSLMVATAPLPASFWSHHGLANAETFSDDRHVVIYGQRTADDRLAFGGRGAPYHFGSTVEPRFDEVPRVFDMIEATLHELFDDFDAEVTHRWGGPLAMPRDLCPSVVVDRTRGIATAGGYTGDGVVLSRVAATAVASLITNVADPAATLPFVGHVRRRWEPEPLRWLGINAGLRLAARADATEQRGRESRAAHTLGRLLGD